MKEVKIGNVTFSEKHLGIIAGPCVIEDEKTTFQIAQKIKSITDHLNIDFILKH